MKQILVLQNQRIGDTLQTTPLLCGLREKYDPCRITIVTNRLYADLNLGSLADEIINFDQNGLCETLQDPNLSIARKYDYARGFLDPLCTRRFDLVIDVPADTNMHLLASALRNAGNVRGVTLSPGRSWSYSHPEVMLLYTIGLCREVNRFNLVDLHNLLAGVRPSEQKLRLPLDQDAESYAAGFWAENGIDPQKDVVVALQAGASEERKRWGEVNFAQLARMLVERLGARALLCGSSEEQSLGARIAREAGVPVVSAIGKTGISQLASMIRGCRLLVTNDTGTMHIAAAVGTPVIDISTGPVFFRETGPYAEGSIVVESDIGCSPCNFNAVCRHYACRESIKPEMLLRLAEMLLYKENAAFLSAQDFQGVRIHRATFNDVGRLDFKPLFRYPMSLFQFLGFFYAHTWEVFYGMRPSPKTAAAILAEIAEMHDIEKSWPFIFSGLKESAQDLRHVEEQLCVGEKNLCPARASVEEFEKIYNELSFFGATRPSVRHFTTLLSLALESQSGVDPLAALNKIRDSVRFLARQVQFLRRQLVEAAQLLENGQKKAS